MTREQLVGLVTEAVRDPRANARRIVALPLPGNTLFETLVLVSLLAIIGVYCVAWIALRGQPEIMDLPAPFAMVALQIGAMLLLTVALTVIGRGFKGAGDFQGSLRIMVWLQFLMVIMQAVQLVALLVLPPLAGLLSLVSIALLGWISTGLIAGLHGFRSLGLTLLGMIGGMIMVSIVLMLLLAPFLPAPV